jgi:phosphinothricin acetyltransferase
MTLIRVAREADAPAIAAIYAPFVESTAISFEMEPPSAREMSARVSSTLQSYPWLVLEADGAIRGYAYASALRTRAAYRWSVETTVYVRNDQHRGGVGRALYTALLGCLATQGFVAAYGGITLPNPASVRFHEALGFACVGVFPSVGYKLGAWHDVGFYQRLLAPRPEHPEPPRAFAAVRDQHEVLAAIAASAC